MALLVNGLSALAAARRHRARPHAHAHDPDNPEDVVAGAAHDPDHDHARGPAAKPSRTHGHALNLRGAWLHLLGDALGAVAALVAALVIRFGGSRAADPIASFAVAAILAVGAVRLLRDATLVCSRRRPPHLPVSAIREVIAGSPGVLEVHDLHVWTLGAGHDAVTVHVRTDSRDPRLRAATLAADSQRTGRGIRDGPGRVRGRRALTALLPLVYAPARCVSSPAPSSPPR